MSDKPSITKRIYQRLVGAKPDTLPLLPGTHTVAEGETAVSGVESWASETVIRASTSREGLAEATGRALAGFRTAVFLSETDTAGTLDLLSEAARKHLPIVVHFQTRSGRGPAGVSGHEAIHQLAEAGCPVLIAVNVQEAVDFTLIAHHIAEEALLPVVVAMDGAETAASVQDLFVPERELVDRFLGSPGEIRHPKSPAQEMLFGKHRRRVPRWYSAEQPMLTGMLNDGQALALGAAARRAFEGGGWLRTVIEDAFAEFANQTGRHYATLRTLSVKGADQIWVAMGAGVETAEATATQLRGAGKKIGVIGIRVLRPFPAARMRDLLQSANDVVVLECVEAPRFGKSPLTRDLATETTGANLRDGAEGRRFHRGHKEIRFPALRTAFYGIGRSALRSADLSALIQDREGDAADPVILGLDVNPPSSDFPKRQVLLDGLRRHYPEAETLGLRGGRGPEAKRSTTGESLAVFRDAWTGGDNLARSAGALLHKLRGGHLRTRSRGVGAGSVDRLILDEEFRGYPGDDHGIRVAVLLTHNFENQALLEALEPGGALLVDFPVATQGVWGSLPAPVRTHVLEHKIALYAARVGKKADPALHHERLLGALIKVLDETGEGFTPRQLMTARKQLLEHGSAPVDPLLAEFQAGYDGVLRMDTTGLTVDTGATSAVSREPAVPRAVRGSQKSEAPVGSLPRFWDQVGILYQEGTTSELAPDPYIGSAVLPPATTALRDLSQTRHQFPVFNPESCTACGLCWTLCPDGAISPLVLGLDALVDGGMAAAKASGASPQALTRVKSKLINAVRKQVRESSAGMTAGEIVRSAWERMLEKTPLPEDQKQDMDEAIGAVERALLDLPLARTEFFFDHAEAERSGTGEVFSLAVDPNACKACGICVAVCEPEALTAAEQTAVVLQRGQDLWAKLQALPTTSEESIARASTDPRFGPLPGMMLNAETRSLLAGGDGAEPGSGARTALRMILGAAHHDLKSTLEKHLQVIEKEGDRFSETIRGTLAEALPAGDLNALAKGLSAVDRAETDLRDLTGRIETAFDSGKVEVVRLRRMVEIARRLEDLRSRLSGSTASLGLVLGSPSISAWAGIFPDNAFTIPVTVSTGSESAQLAQGLVRGIMRRHVEDIALLRRARLELDHPEEAERDETIAALSWSDLEPAERAALPALFFVTDEESVLHQGLSGLVELLADESPVRILVLSPHPDSGFSGAAGPSLGLMAMTGERAYVTQTSIAEPGHLAASIAGAVTHDGPSLVQIYAPSPGSEHFPSDATVERAREAIASRVFPLFRYDPGAEGPRLNLEGNPETEADSAGEAPQTAWQRLRFLAAAERGSGDGSLAGDAVNALKETHKAELAKQETELKAALDGLQRQHAAEMEALRSGMQMELAQRVRNRLLALWHRSKITENAESVESSVASAPRQENGKEGS